MALMKCSECGAEMSDKAAACPSCGSPPEKKSSSAIWVVIIAGLFLLLIIIASSNGGKSGASKSSGLMGGTFSSLESCLSRIQSKTGTTISKLTRDRPDEVAGKLSNGKSFGCDRKETGTQGVVWEGWYYK